MYTEDYGTYDYPDWYNELLTAFLVERWFVGKLKLNICSTAKNDKLMEEINSKI